MKKTKSLSFPLLISITILFTLSFTLTGCFSSGTTVNTAGNAISAQNHIEKVIKITKDESDEYVTSLAFGNDILWIGTEHFLYSVLPYTPAEDRRIKKYIDAADNCKINSINVKDEKVYIAGFEGFSYFNGQSWERQPIGNSNEIIPVGNDLWSATNSGAEILRNNSGEWRKLDVSSATSYSPTKQMQSIGTDGTNYLWLGTLFGLHRFDLAAHKEFMGKLSAGSVDSESLNTNHFWKRLYGDYQSPMGGMVANEKGNCPLTGNNIQKIKFDKENNRYLFCTKNGLSILKKGQWTTYKGTGSHLVAGLNGEMKTQQRTGNLNIPTPEIYDIISFEGKLYLATRSGLGILTESDKSSQLITLETGLPSNDVTSLAIDVKQKTLFIGTASGIGIMKL